MAQIGADLTGTATTQTAAPAADHSQMRISMVSVRSDDTTVTRSANTENEPDTESTSPYCSDDEWEPEVSEEKSPKVGGGGGGALNIRLGSDGDSTINVNASNNKKREGSTQSAEHDASSESSQKPTKTERQPSSNKPKTTTEQHNNGLYIRPLRGDRNHSVQISSIRGLGKLEKEKKRSHWITPGHRYGKRLIEKDGSSNVYLKDLGRRDLVSRYWSDLFTTLLDSSWKMVLFLTMLVYVSHWIIFGLIYWFFAVLNSDTDVDKEDPCVFHVYNFVSAFLYSMESETTIGYGYRGMNTQCPHAVVTLTVQCIIAAIFDTWVIGMCYARLARPDARIKTTLFSTNAVICRRDGKRCLILRIANLRKSLLVSSSIKARLISFRSAQSKEKVAGYDLIPEQRDVAFINAQAAFLTSPVEYCHIIDKTSPLFRVKSDMYDKAKENYFELVVTLTGTLESTGLVMQAQTSYLSSEILYGHRFKPIVSRDYKRGKYVADFAYFHHTIKEPTLANHERSSTNSFSKFKSATASTQLTDLYENVSDEVFSVAETPRENGIDDHIV